ncbi:heme ABC transporter ATP-binding protein [Clostridium tagluense]|uniref:heme ABC transporter ATP-binding protein n=1 Tax=Clostridium TaxID=1485 RepID=UPI0013E94E9E|nr:MULTISPECIES: heme ABC transporter ATP-binding protein [Clostridium]MBU3130241.1 heme ABC transporter ATP-binding protein [Clostridium tagluense]MBW9159691.1 heme ABC transporter ATP-binding protein [Clostridium tagluense]MBZ9623518.1 heme ABC transporter ATP-binding protein [Clostridium sp. FP2]MCB2313838.1 heme ABC transporter ATP-binding protein [Clostridium tagluense]MCB2318681.1 heme ABC transporter ATP-binding protein [Clostridium tagluense]
MIEINNVCFSFEKEVLKNININIERGKFYTILGPNGSGKTTLLRILSKSLPMEKGEIYIDEVDLTQIKPKVLAKEMAVVPQSTEIEFDFSVQDIVLMGRTPHISRFCSESEKDINIAMNAMKITNTWELRNKSINALSGGEKQRVVVARAIAQETGIILLDEPISHLDIHHQIEIMNQLKELNQNKNITIIAVLHDLNLAAAYCDHMILMHNCGVYKDGIPEEVLTEDIIKKVYGLDVYITKNPKTKKTFIMPF